MKATDLARSRATLGIAANKRRANHSLSVRHFRGWILGRILYAYAENRIARIQSAPELAVDVAQQLQDSAPRVADQIGDR